MNTIRQVLPKLWATAPATPDDDGIQPFDVRAVVSCEPGMAAPDERQAHHVVDVASASPDALEAACEFIDQWWDATANFTLVQAETAEHATVLTAYYLMTRRHFESRAVAQLLASAGCAPVTNPALVELLTAAATR